MKQSEWTRRNFLRLAGAAGAGVAAGASHVPAAAAAEKPMTEPRDRPNLIYLFADQLRYFSCGYAGDKLARTPNIDRLRAEGVSFSNAVSGHPVCAPYRASLFTGKYTTSTGMVINELRLSPEHECLGHVLTRGGYRTGYIGKWHLWANELGHHYDDRNGFTPPGPYRLGFDGLWAAYNFHHVYHDAFYYADTPEKVPYGPKGTYEPDAQTDLAIGFLKDAAKKKQPFALFVSYGTPHDPWNPGNAPEKELAAFADVDFPLPPNFSTRSDPYGDGWARLPGGFGREMVNAWKRTYYAQTANLDRNIGRLLKALADAGLAENTVVVFTSDHGEMFGAQGRHAKNIFYEEAVRVPFLVRWPGRIGAGSTSDACLNTVDILPTLLGLLDLPTPKAAEGDSLAHCALGKPGPEPPAAFLQCTGTTAAWSDGHEWRAVRDKRFTYAIYRRDKSELLFDHQADPYQQKNLIDDPRHAADADRLRTLLKAKMAELNDEFPPCTWYREHWTKDRNIVRTARGGSHDLDQLDRIIAKHFPRPTGVQLDVRFAGLADDAKAVADASPAQRKLTRHGGKLVEGSTAGARAMQLDGKANFLDLPAEACPDPTGARITVLAKTRADRPDGVVLAHGGNKAGYVLHFIEGRPAFTVRVGGNPAAAVAKDKVPGWVRLAGQIDDNGRVKLYVDGNLAARAKARGPIPIKPQDGLQIGCDGLSNVGDYSGDGHFTGAVESVKIMFGACEIE